MADDVTVHNGDTGNGAAFDVATDDDGSGNHVQIVKLARSADGSRTAISADADGLLVNLGANNDVVISDGGGSITVDGSLSVTPVATSTQVQDSSSLTTASTTYTAGDVLGAGWTFTSMSSGAGAGGIIIGAVLLDDGDVVTAIDLYLASGSITFGSDNAAPSVSDADAGKIVGQIGIPFTDVGNSRVGAAHGLQVPYHCDSTSLYVYARTLDNHNFFAAADDLHLRLYYKLG